MEKDAYYYYMVANEQFKNGQIEEAINIFSTCAVGIYLDFKCIFSR